MSLTCKHWSPLTESNRRPSPYHGHGAAPQALCLHRLTPERPESAECTQFPMQPVHGPFHDQQPAPGPDVALSDRLVPTQNSSQRGELGILSGARDRRHRSAEGWLALRPGDGGEVVDWGRETSRSCSSGCCIWSSARSPAGCLFWLGVVRPGTLRSWWCVMRTRCCSVGSAVRGCRGRTGRCCQGWRGGCRRRCG